jgi:hypothetical protein
MRASTEPARLGDFVWDDLNAQRHPGRRASRASRGVTVHLLTNGTIVASTTTDVSGFVCVHEPAAVESTAVQVVPPAGWTDHAAGPGRGRRRGQRRRSGHGPDDDHHAGQRPGRSDLGRRACTIPPSLGDFVCGLDRERRRHPRTIRATSRAFANVLVTLLRRGHERAGRGRRPTRTASTSLHEPGAGERTSLNFTPPAGYQPTLRDQGADDALRQRRRPWSRATPCSDGAGISGENDPTWDAGLYRAGERSATSCGWTT